MGFGSIDELEGALRDADYLPDRGLSTALYLSLALGKPLLLEGEAGVGKTEPAKSLRDVARRAADPPAVLRGPRRRARRLRVELRAPAAAHPGRAGGDGDEDELFGPEFLIRRPLLEAIDSEEPVVLLIDEIDRADDEFEAFLLEVLSDFQITIPEIGTITAQRRPAVILTSNRTRELHDALKRRCLFHWIGHPSLEREIEIVRLRVPGIPERLAAEAAAFVAELRGLDLAKAPGVAETIDWAQALIALGREELDAEVVEQTLGSVLKYHEDIDACATRRSRGSWPRRARRRPRRRRAVTGEALIRHVVTFGRVLREAGMEVGPGRVADALRGLDALDLTRQEDVYCSLRPTFVARRDDLDLFDRAFDAWFLRAPGAAAGPRADRAQRCTRGRGARPTRCGPARRRPAGRAAPVGARATSCCARRTSPR